nr:hypothetical protein BaRGS_002062 [Batillaria attramentaria]
MLEWVVELAIRFDKWEFLDAALETCHDQSLINRAVSEAADFDQWSLIRHHIDRCEMDEFDLARILRQALPLVRLLHESGSSSNCELFLLKNDASIRAQLERQRRQDIVQYLDRAASNPASLQHLCRLTVSHLVGCRPGRRDRVASLPLTWCTKDLVLFEDLT